MTASVSTQRLLLSSADVRVFEGKRGTDGVFVTQVVRSDAHTSVRDWVRRVQPAGVELIEDDGALTVITQADKGVRFDALSCTEPLSVRDAVALVVQATEVVQERLDDGHDAAVRVRPWHVWLNNDGRVSYETYGLPPGLAAELQPGIATWADAYRTPAFLRGGAASATSDVFSLGATLAHLLTGRPAFDAGEQSATFEAIRRGDVTPPSLQRSEITPELEDVILRSVHADASKRFDSPEALGKALLEAAVGSVGTASRRDLRALSAARAAAASAWLDEHPAPLGEDDPTLIVAKGDSPALDWGDDEETHVWGDDVEQEITDDDVLDPDAPATVVIDRDEIRTTAPPIPAAASGASATVGVSDEVTAPTQAALVERSAAEASLGPAAAQVATLSAARPPQRPIASEDQRTTTQTRRPGDPKAAAEDGSGIKWMAMLALVVLGVAFVLLRPQCGPGDGFDVQLALSPTDVEYRAFVDGSEVTSGRQPLVLPGLTAGDHALRVEAEGFAPYERLLTVGPNTERVHQAQLQPLLGAADSGAAANAQPRATPVVAAIGAGSGNGSGAGSGDGATSGAAANADAVPAGEPENPAGASPTEQPPGEPASAAQQQNENAARTVEAERAAAAELASRREEAAAATAERLREQERERDERLRREAAAQAAATPPDSRVAAAEEQRRATEAAERAEADRRATEERQARERAAAEERAQQEAAAEEQARREAAEAAATPPASTEPGFLNVQSVPAARVFIDGEDTGRFTPMINVPLPPGRHRVRLVNAEFDLDRSYTITIESGRPRTVLNRQAQ